MDPNDTGAFLKGRVMKQDDHADSFEVHLIAVCGMGWQFGLGGWTSTITDRWWSPILQTPGNDPLSYHHAGANAPVQVHEPT